MLNDGTLNRLTDSSTEIIVGSKFLAVKENLGGYLWWLAAYSGFKPCK